MCHYPSPRPRPFRTAYVAFPYSYTLRITAAPLEITKFTDTSATILAACWT